MEFYLHLQQIVSGFRKFQFPTGWNSTLWRRLGYCGRIVSIPNGMEFYSNYAFWCSQYTNCFKSQRDGILQLPLIAEILGKNGFNSQRDGILQINACFFAFYKDVSIPNGMEFYLDARPFLTNCLWFQFPTGWNSTLKPVWEQSPH